MSYLLDTSFIIDALLRREVPLSVFPALRHTRTAISIITLAELYEGSFHRTNPGASIESMHKQLRGSTVLPLTELVCLRFAEIRARLRRSGVSVGDFDLFIAATALEHDLTLVTRNTRDFEQIPELRLADL